MSTQTDLYIDGKLIGTCEVVKSSSATVGDETYYSYRVVGFKPLDDEPSQDKVATHES